MDLNTDKKKITVWLAKLPKYLGERITKLQNNATAGKLHINGSEIKIRFSDSVLSSGIPTEYTVDLREKDNGMYLVNSKNMNIQGHINKECFIKPVINSQYLEFKRNLSKTKDLVAETMVVDYYTEAKRTSKYSSIKEMDILARKRKEMLQSKKRERLNKEDVMEIVFNAFEKHSLWTVKDLADFSGQPLAYIQEIVNEICVLNKRDHKNTYELRPEYKQSF